MSNIMMTVLIFFIVYSLYLVGVVWNKKKLEHLNESPYVSFIIQKYQLDFSKINKKTFAHTICLTNSVIITITFFITDFISHYLFKFLVGFCLFIPLILLGYNRIGLYYQKKEVKKNV